MFFMFFATRRQKRIWETLSLSVCAGDVCVEEKRDDGEMMRRRRRDDAKTVTTLYIYDKKCILYCESYCCI
jgi:hypothetical protein